MNPERPFGAARPLSPPMVPSSVYVIPDLATLDRISEAHEDGFIYARDRHPNAALLATELARLESGEWGVVAASGMGAIAAALVAGCKAGDRVVASDQLYGRTSQFLSREFARFGVTTTYVDTSNLDAVRRTFSTPARMLIVETISNPLLRVADLPRLSEIAGSSGCQLVVDNTFATPVLCRPLEYGADLVIESLTKLIGGHSDVTLGVVCGRDKPIGDAVASTVSVWGFNPGPFDCWMALRSLQTLDLRVRASCAHAEEVAQWLTKQTGIRHVIYPGLGGHPDREIARNMIAGPPGNMIACELNGGRPAVEQFLKLATEIPFCPSLGDTRTTVSYPAATSHRYVPAEEKARLGITDGLIRFSIGIEPVAEICAHIRRAFIRD